MLRRDVLRFIVVFVLLTSAGFALLQSAWVAPAMWRLKVGTTSVVATLVSALGTPAVADGSHVRFAGTWIHVIDECTGIYALVLLVAFVLAFPNGWRRRAVALVAGVVTVSVINVVRLVVLAWLMVHRPSTAAFAHDYLWQVVWAGALIGFAALLVRQPAIEG